MTAADLERRLLARTRRLVTLQVAAGVSAPLLLAWALSHRAIADGPPETALCGGDAAEARRRIRRALAAAEVAGLLAAPLAGHLLARRALAPLGDALDRRARLAADAGHELRAPLSRLHLRAQLLARRLQPGTDVADDMERLVVGTRQLGEVLDDVLRASRPARRREEGAPVDLAALAEEEAAAEKARAEARGVTIDVLRRGDDHLVRGTEPALRRVVTALLDNAVRHAEENVRVMVARGPSGLVELTVQDDGAGLDPRDAGRYLTRFTGAHAEGFGLGLALAREVVDAHDGTLTVAGRPGAGAAFTVRLHGPGSRRRTRIFDHC
ncbi:sensor histidine kinase [Actinomadura litoris]|uniref:sensor histidine kinase n=1 Tax=Actinomadura litoris TaxID=2678616 RepID=UPI001FA7A8D6|nr:HAMP domain-containing sensor histidine kinase [Actinomadura litoris]